MTSFGLLHLSDLHLGNPEREPYSAQDQARFLEDLQKAHELVGLFDLVVISGNLTDSGTPEQFARVEGFVQKLWERLGELGSQPKLLTVPGERDVQLPSETDTEVLALAAWESNSKISEVFWSQDAHAMRKKVTEVFAPYQSWRATGERPRGLSPTEGLLPGDCSAFLKKGDVQLGLVGLNTSFLQLWAEQRFRMEVDLRQLNAVCSPDPPAWFEKQDLTLLITHGAQSLLSKRALSAYKEFIYPPDRFALHLFGRSDELPRLERLSGAGSRCFLPGLSLFGRGGASRVGYQVARIEVAPTEVRFQVHTRLAQKNLNAGYTRFVLEPEVWKESIPRVPRNAAPVLPATPEPILDEVLKILASIDRPEPLCQALQALGQAPPAQQEALRRALAMKLLQPQEASLASIKEAFQALSPLQRVLREQFLRLLKLITPFRWVPAKAARMLADVTQRALEQRVVGLNAEDPDFTGRMYACRANPDDTPHWDLILLSKLYEGSFEEIQRQIYDCLKSRFDLETDAAVDDELGMLEDTFKTAVLVLFSAPSLSRGVLRQLQQHFRTLTFLLFTGTGEPPAPVDVLLPRLDPNQEREVQKLHHAARRLIDRQQAPSRG
ncbi:metallophosphoesterase [Hyalangium versicolor]|uniref:metallophosphoesterase n=1 Tax=Hyalangium versicolor TaxID=2861190 RepID=UPI001CCECE32|nr:metallophosphoesterase [Hyalangium versicolor]